MRAGKIGCLLVAVFTVVCTGSVTAAVHPKSGRKAARIAGGRAAETLPLLIQGRVSAVDGDVMTVKTPDYGPGLSHGSGIHSMLIVQGKSYSVNISTSAFELPDGTRSQKLKIAVGDSIVAILSRPVDPQAAYFAVVIELAK